VDRQAFTYRGSRQSEDEAEAGRALLIRLLSDPQWTRLNYYLALQVVAAVPHGIENSLLRRIRALALVVAEADARFQNLRAKIHSAPDPGYLERVRQFQPNEAAAAPRNELIAAMEKQRDSRRLAQAIPALGKKFAGTTVGDRAASLSPLLTGGNTQEAVAVAAGLSRDIRTVIETSKDGKRNLELADFLATLSDWVFEHAPEGAATRRKSPKARVCCLIAKWRRSRLNGKR